MHGAEEIMQDSYQWNSEQKKRAHSRIFEDLMRLHNLTEAQIVARLGDDDLKTQSTISRWKTLAVRPNRHIYLDLVRNIFQLNYEQIDAMLWLSGMPPLLMEEVKLVLGKGTSFQDKTENNLALAAYKLLIDIIGNDLGLPSPQWETKLDDIAADVNFTFSIKTRSGKIAIEESMLPLKLDGQYRPVYARPFVWVVLQDVYSNYYLQSPPVYFLPDGRWIADNILPGKGITTIHFVTVGVQGHAAFMKKVRQREWGAFQDLPGDGKIIKSLRILLKPD
jgi:hypothetical protein